MNSIELYFYGVHLLQSLHFLPLKGGCMSRNAAHVFAFKISRISVCYCPQQKKSKYAWKIYFKKNAIFETRHSKKKIVTIILNYIPIFS